MTTQNAPSSPVLQNLASLYLLTLLIYAPFIIHFTWGNHDWAWVQENTPLFSGVFEGRFSQFILQTILFDKNILPVLTILTAFLTFSAGTLLLFKLWDVPTKKTYILLLGLNLICSPFTLSWLYFAFIILSCLTWPLCIFTGYYCLSRLTGNHRKALYFSVSVLLFTLALGGYPPVINLIGITLFTLVLNDLCLNKLSPQDIARKYLPHICAIITSLIIFISILHLLKKYGLQSATYNTAGITLHEAGSKLIFSLIASIKQFFVTFNFITPGYKYLNLGLFLAALYRLIALTPKHPTALLCLVISITGLLTSSIATLFAAENMEHVLYAPRIDFFSLIYIYIFSASLLIKSPHRLTRNITLITLIILLGYNIKTNAEAAKIWQAGFKAEMALSERFLSRLESDSRFSLLNTYTFVQSGTSDFRNRYYTPENVDEIDAYTLSAPYIPWHLPSKAYRFYYPKNIFGTDFDIFWTYINPNILRPSNNLLRYLTQTAEPWPKQNAIFIENDTIIFTLSPEGRDRGKNWADKFF